MSTSSYEYGYIEDVERLEDYRLGVHKLGHGAFSTVWLALDEPTSKYVAVKVGTADAERREVDILSQLTTGAGTAACSNATEKASMIPLVLDRFSLDGPNGTHPCVVAFPARCSLMDAKEASDPRLFQLDVARSRAAQLAIALQFVHSQGYSHGDLHLGNLLLQLPSSLNDLPLEQLYAKYGAPEPQPVVPLYGKPTSVSGVPSYVFPPIGRVFESHTPLVIRPPEVFFEPTTPLSLASDIWSVGCTIFELLAHRSLIDGILTLQDENTAQQVHLQGPLLSEWWDKWEQRSKWFDEAGNPISNEPDIWTWDRRFEQWIQEPRQFCSMGVVDEEERVALLELLQWMLAWRPGERPSAEHVLGTAWMKRWALPAYEQGKRTWN
ncbi:kinase-like protein [Coniochaeta sp. PMI_546]|nr:kinase-like protein [Coniochaeta sp. PMI_546]